MISDFRKDRDPRLGAGRPQCCRCLPASAWNLQEFPLADLHRYVHEFAFIAGYQQHRFQGPGPDQSSHRWDRGRSARSAVEPAAAEMNSNDSWYASSSVFFLPKTPESSSTRHCGFLYETAKATAAWPRLARLFDVLNTPPEKRQQNLDETLGGFPLRQRRVVRRASRLCRLQPRRAEPPACLHAFLLVVHLAGGVR